MWPSSNQNRINLQIIIFRPVIILEFFYVRVFYFHAEDLYGVCAFDDRNNRTLTGRYEANEDMTSSKKDTKNITQDEVSATEIDLEISNAEFERLNVSNLYKLHFQSH